MRKEWNIETVDITPVAPQKQEENVPLTKKDKIKALKKELDKAISEQNFEHAAELRDQIKEMEA